VHNKEIVHDGITYDCEIIDTAGQVRVVVLPPTPLARGLTSLPPPTQDEYSLFNHKYAVGIHGYVLVYSIASRQSFDMIANLHDKITEFQGVNKVCCVVVGQKSDLGEARWVLFGGLRLGGVV
jgi:Ras family protein